MSPVIKILNFNLILKLIKIISQKYQKDFTTIESDMISKRNAVKYFLIFM